MKKIFLIIAIFSNSVFTSMSQDVWVVPAPDKDKISQFTFDHDFSLEGQTVYENYCISCHGSPTENNFSRMDPSPGDPGAEAFQSQTDGEMFYRIKTGRGSMPGFANIMADDEIWSLVSYIRSFNDAYTQKKFVLEGVIIPEIAAILSFDENTDKLVVTVSSEGNPFPRATVTAYINAYLGNYLLGTSTTNELGIAYFDVNSTIPPDSDGNLKFSAKVSKEYAFTKETATLLVGEGREKTNLIAGRHIWSSASNPPIWLIIAFSLTTIGIWSVIIYILFELRKLYKLKNS